MERSEGEAEMEILRSDDEGNPHPAGGEPISNGPSAMTHDHRRRRAVSYRCLIISVFILAQSIAIIVMGVKLPHCQTAPATGLEKPTKAPLSSQDWKRRKEGRAYYFSEVEGNWTYSESFCKSHSSSLVVIENQEEMDYLKNTGSAEYWLGLWRENLTDPWKRLDGSLSNKWYAIEGEGRCAYLGEQVVSSTYCDNQRSWICKKQL